MGDEDNPLFRAFGGRNRAIAVIVALLVALAFFIAGAVMLGVGIHKANSKPTCGDDKSQQATTIAPTNAPLTKSPQTVTPKPFYLTVTDRKYTPQQLSDNFETVVKGFRDQVTTQLTGSPVVTLLSATPANEGTPNAAVVGLLAVVYTSDSELTQTQIATAIQNDPDLTVQQIEGGDVLPESADNQLCSSVNSEQPPTPEPGVSSKTTTSATTTTTERPGPEDYIPCDKRMVVALDSSSANPNFNVMRDFLIYGVFEGNWNHTERLGVAWYTSKVDYGIRFNELSDTGKKDLDFVRRLINTRRQSPTKAPSLSNTLRDLDRLYQPNENYPRVYYTVFVSTLTEQDVQSAKQYADQLNNNGRLTIVALGNDIDPTDTLIKQLTSHYIHWRDMDTNKMLPGWEEFFWREAYGCVGNPPAPPPSIPPEPTLVLPTTQPTEAPAPKPCEGRVVILLDTSRQLTSTEFNDQKTFIGQRLFSGDYFNTYTRLSIGYYTREAAIIDEFGFLQGPEDVRDKVDAIQQSTSDNAFLRRALSSIQSNNYEQGEGPITVVIFVSALLTTDEVTDAKAIATQIQAQGVRLYLVAHGSSATASNLAQVTGDSSTTYKWQSGDAEPPNYQQWFRTVINCPNQMITDEEFFNHENKQFVVNPEDTQLVARPEEDYLIAEPEETNQLVAANPENNQLSIGSPEDDLFVSADSYPCPGKIIVLYDRSNGLSQQNFQKEVSFLKNQVFNNQWTDLGRLAVISYATFPMPQVYGRFQTLQDVREFIDEEPWIDVNPNLRRAFKEVLDDTLVEAHDPSHTIVFVSKISQDIVDDSKPYVDQIQAAASIITFVAMGNDVNVELLKELSPYVITWDIDNKQVPDGWVDQFWTAYGCQGNPPTVAPPTGIPPTGRPRPTTPKPEPFVPCGGFDGPEVAIYFENGRNLNVAEYRTVIRFLQTQVFDYWNHFERLILGYYNRYVTSYEPGFFRRKEDVVQYLSEIPQSSDPSILRRLFSSLVDDPIPSIDDFPKVFIIFVSSISQESADDIKLLYPRFQHTKLTFVALKSASQQILKQIVPDVIDWSDLSKPAPTNWDTLFWAAYGCEGDPPATKEPFTGPTTPAAPTTSAAPTTTPGRRTPRPPASTTFAPYEPCERQIIMMFDQSKNLPANLYTKLTDFLSHTLFTEFNHFERLGFGYFAKNPTTNDPGMFYSLEALQTYIKNIEQSKTENPVFRRAIQSLQDEDKYPTNMKKTIVFLVSKMTQDDVDDSKSAAEAIKEFARLVLVGLQSSVEESKLKQLTENTLILDLAQPIPTDIRETFAQLYGCNEP